jgi:hypothetical protein
MTHKEIIDSARWALAAKIGDDATDAMFAHVTQRQKTPQRLEEAIEELLKSHNIAWPPESSSPKPKPAAAAVAGASKAPAAPKPPPEKSPTKSPRGEHQKGGFFAVPNLIADELIAAMPGPVLKAYLFACRYADADGSFWFSHLTLAKKIGCKDRRHGERVVRRLIDAGLIRQLERGGPGGKANVYQLAGLQTMDYERARQFLSSPLRADTGPRARTLPVLQTGVIPVPQPA